jgi:hypothetical protein
MIASGNVDRAVVVAVTSIETYIVTPVIVLTKESGALGRKYKDTRLLQVVHRNNMVLIHPDLNRRVKRSHFPELAKYVRESFMYCPQTVAVQ